MRASALLLPLAFVLAGCATSVVMPTTRFESPEVIGQTPLFRPHVRVNPVGISGANTAVLTDNYVTDSVNHGSPRIVRDVYYYTGSAGFAASHRLEVGFRYVHASPALLQLKYQWIGSPRDGAHAGNFSFSTSLAGGLTSTNFTGTNTALNQAATFRSTVAAGDVALLAGYRPLETLLVYLTPWATFYPLSGRRDVRDATTGAFVSTQDFAAVAKNFGVNLGLSLDVIGLFIVRGEGSINYAILGTAEQLGYQGGLVVGMAL